ncbi:hypothetical protein [Phyllobacterium zundukense]|uniref:Uncharacterized protein n=1 Tax=Phyllobacterium zundukense TaxID=1867719 RepID=A0ACD4CX89_9HYPH|nr:hypothetical protein [Phyllobacterium zundukense]UXN58154.1 hypothetical protein N8E88_04840 [Phyllobacterium zundukense]
MSETPLVLGDADANWQALADFVQQFRIKLGHQLLCSFVADVSFRSDRNVDERTCVYIDFHAGAVSPVRLETSPNSFFPSIVIVHSIAIAASVSDATMVKPTTLIIGG